ncbi:MAG: hypothetical protein J7J31_01985 [Helicobacteraceae bacterium]|nr:hypothetical protein [Helicobacteraceae bacterium]
MKKIKTTILSFLLLSLCFVSFHDYMVAQDHIKELSCSEIHLEKEKCSDSVVHDSMHHLFAHLEIETFSLHELNRENPSFQQVNMSFHKASVLLRPPLS